MPNEILLDIFERIAESIQMVEERFSEINHASDFKATKQGETNFDAIMMRFQIVGELLKQADKLDNVLLSKFPQVQWNEIMKMREIISHHYDLLDYEVIYLSCKTDLPILKTTVAAIVVYLKSRK